MEDVFPNLFRTFAAFLDRYGLVAVIPLVMVIIWVAFPRGSMRLAAAVVAGVIVIFLFFGDHPAISPVTSAMGAAFYHFRSMLR